MFQAALSGVVLMAFGVVFVVMSLSDSHPAAALRAGALAVVLGLALHLTSLWLAADADDPGDR